MEAFDFCVTSSGGPPRVPTIPVVPLSVVPWRRTRSRVDASSPLRLTQGDGAGQPAALLPDATIDAGLASSTSEHEFVGRSSSVPLGRRLRHTPPPGESTPRLADDESDLETASPLADRAASAAHAQHTAVTCCTCYICSKVVVLVLNSTIRQCSTCPARGCHDCVRRLREANVCSTCFSKISSWDEYYAHVAQQQFCQRTAQLPNRSSSSSSNSSTTPQPQQHNTSIESQQEHWEPAAAVLPTRESVNLYLDKLFAEKAAAKAAKAAAKKRARLT
jgi:hypothetical protein